MSGEKERERGESQSYRGKERVIKKEETECMKLDSKLYKASREEKGKRQKDREKRRFYSQIRYTERNPC